MVVIRLVSQRRARKLADCAGVVPRGDSGERADGRRDPDAFDQSGALFAIPLAVIFLTALAMLVLGLDSASEAYRSALHYSGPNIIAMAMIVAGGFIDGQRRRIAWIAGIVVFIVATIQSGSGQWIVRAGHFAERHGLIIIVALGQAVVVPLENDGGFPAESVVALVAAGAFAGLLWSAYFDRVGPALEHRAEEAAAADRGRFARDVYSYAHCSDRRRHQPVGGRHGGDGAPPVRPAFRCVSGRRMRLAWRCTSVAWESVCTDHFGQSPTNESWPSSLSRSSCSSGPRSTPSCC